MRALWSLPKAAPALLRHLGAYVELAGEDFEVAQRNLTARFAAMAVVTICGVFVLLLGCLGVIAYTWDTPYRMSAIFWLLGGFGIAAIGAALYARSLARASAPLFSTVRKEWREDRVILEHILSADEE